jgi:hypothetical protein
MQTISRNLTPNNIRSEDYSRRGFLRTAGALALGGLAAYGLSRIPLSYGQSYTAATSSTEEEPTLTVPLAERPLSTTDLTNKTWLNSNAWQDSLELQFGDINSIYGYIRCKHGGNPKYLSLLVDSVTDTAEKPYGGVGVDLDSQNKRFLKGRDGNYIDPSLPRTTGFYTALLLFNSPGGQLRDVDVGDPGHPGVNFPSGTLYFDWARGPSPITGNDQSRSNPHFLVCLLISESVFASTESGFKMNIYGTEQVSLNGTDFPAGPEGEGYPDLWMYRTSLSSAPVNELPLSALLASGLVAAALVALGIYKRISGRKIHSKATDPN